MTHVFVKPCLPPTTEGTDVLTHNEIQHQARALRGAALKVYLYLQGVTAGGRRAHRVCANIIATMTGYSIRAVWRAIARLESSGLIRKRRRFARILGVWKKIANEYRLTKPAEVVIAKVLYASGGFVAWVAAKRICANAGRMIPQSAYSEDVFAGRGNRNTAVERAMARINARRS